MTLSYRWAVFGLENSELVKLILLLGSIAGALAAISALIVKIVKVVKKGIQYFKDLKDSVNTLVENVVYLVVEFHVILLPEYDRAVSNVLRSTL